MIRDARFEDIPAIMAVIRWGYQQSDYAKKGLCGLDEKEAKRLLVNAIQRHGRGRNAGSFVQVAERDGKVEGFIVGILSRVYHIGDRLMASDLFWLCTPMVPPRDPRRLMRNMIEWGKGVDGVIEIRCGTTAILGDPERAGAILRSLGLEPYGAIYRKGL